MSCGCFNALASQAKYQGDPQARQIYRALTKRTTRADWNLINFFTLCGSRFNRAIIYTDLEEMMWL